MRSFVPACNVKKEAFAATKTCTTSKYTFVQHYSAQHTSSEMDLIGVVVVVVGCRIRHTYIYKSKMFSVFSFFLFFCFFFSVCQPLLHRSVSFVPFWPASIENKSLELRSPMIVQCAFMCPVQVCVHFSSLLHFVIGRTLTMFSWLHSIWFNKRLSLSQTVTQPHRPQCVHMCALRTARVCHARVQRHIHLESSIQYVLCGMRMPHDCTKLKKKLMIS